MSLNQLHKYLKEKDIKFLFTDYYDTLVHRHVHPNYTQRIWAKYMIRELGLDMSIDELYFIRKDSVKYLAKILKKNAVEISYNKLKEEVCKRLINSKILPEKYKDNFLSLFEDADFKSEASVQYVNQNVLDTLKYFKSNGGKVYLVSDFYGSKSLFKKLLDHHGISELFNGIYSSAELEKSKDSGTLYSHVLSDLSVTPNDVMMIGDNLRSDYNNALKNGLNAYLLPHKKYLKNNKRNNFGNDKKRLQQIINKIYKKSRKSSSIPYTEYVVFYYTFVERMYKICRKDNIKDLFFLSREGQYLKKLFDSYQEFSIIDNTKRINTHYLKISRHASFQIKLKDLKVEQFEYLQKKFPNLPVDNFLSAVNCPENLRNEIISQLNTNGKTAVNAFFSSSIFEELKKNKTFVDYYEQHRKLSNNAFGTYINSFNTDIEANGLSIVDIGWGGTMQEAIYKFFDEKIPVTGYYFGLNEIYDIQPNTKRHGLIFSIMPYKNYSDYILKGNTQLYEQFSAANHGSALDYSLEAKDYTIEHHRREEKWLYDNHIKDHQKEMFGLHESLLKNLDALCYDQDMMQDCISKLALKVGLFQSNKKLKYLDTLSHGFYQNVGNNKVGISYKPPKIKYPKKSIISFLMTPEKYFRYFVKLKPMLYQKNKIVAFLTPMYLIYLYYGFNRYIRFKVLHRYVVLKFNAFK
ncbi:HAD hydrolase-like protein [Winogradskyella sp. R77965]|uniref:HAD hydrolase-like protein n=1 Tax=Winogradskyella sp. R77965 TaxID=3093872 RepID=UPI0037DCA680